MLIDFNNIKEMTVSGMNNGTGEMSARMHIDEERKIIPCAIHAGGSIGLHRHEGGAMISIILYQVTVRQFATVKKKFYVKTHVIYARKAVSIAL